MKVYVDELPKSCKQCNLSWCRNCRVNYNLRCETCPLQSISDYTKQVRKELCEEIREALCMTEQNTVPNTANVVYYDVLNKILDQIQGETNA